MFPVDLIVLFICGSQHIHLRSEFRKKRQQDGVDDYDDLVVFGIIQI
jgi:hypothetical protein